MAITVQEFTQIIRNNPDLAEQNPDFSRPAEPFRRISSQQLTVPTEEMEQERAIAWAALNEVRLPELRLLFHVPNGGVRDIVTAKMLKRAGVKAGVPDLFLPVSRQGFCGLWIEMKRCDHSNNPTHDQSWWIGQLRGEGHRVEVCYGADDAIEVLEDYLK